MLFRPGDYDPQQVLTAAARPSAALWRLVAGVVVMSATWLALLWLRRLWLGVDLPALVVTGLLARVMLAR